jgi:putative DNA primase/helicase
MTTASVDFARIGAECLRLADQLVREWLPAGTCRGAEWRVGGLHGEKGESMGVNLRTGKWSDFATNQAGGDLISLYAAIKNLSQVEAAKELEARFVINITKKAPDPATVEDWTQIPAPEGAAPKMAGRNWRYCDKDGRTMVFIERQDRDGGKKDFYPWTWWRNSTTGECKWRKKNIPDPRPVYGLELLAGNDLPVLVTEGEGKCDCARAMLGAGWVAVSAMGGASAARKTDWAPLHGRRVAIWPDNDEPGRRFAGQVQAAIPGAVIVPIPDGLPEKWDLADATEEQIPDCVARIHAAIETPPEVPPLEDEQPQPQAPFRALGRGAGIYYYLALASRDVVALNAEAHSGKALLRLAPMAYWEAAYSGKKGVAWMAAQDDMMRACEQEGRFSLDRIRGRGAWIDEGRVVVHYGDRLLVDGAPMGILDIASRHIYADQQPVMFSRAPAGNTESRKLIDLFSCLRLSGGALSARLLAGWCALAPICGALAWRPHLWLTGASGQGKSWTISNVIAPAIGDFALNFQGSTTEAGLRQSVGHDAIPVMFDEAEADTIRGQERMQMVMEFARACSCETGAQIVKGSASGEAQTYRPRCMIMYASINASTENRADTRRTTRIEISKTTEDNFKRAVALVLELDREKMAAIRARIAGMVMTIRHNAKVFSDAVMARVGDRCEGDQLGTLLAGAYALVCTKEITQDKAQAWVDEQEWKPVAGEKEDDTAECLNMLMAHIVQCTSGERLSISELCQAGDDKTEVLQRYGIRYSDGVLCVAVRHSQLAKVFAGTAWGGNKWGGAIRRIPGACDSRKHMCGILTRCVCVPYQLFQ